MARMDPAALIAAARKVAGDLASSQECSAGSVGAALLSESGEVFTGICIDARSSLGFCAEHAAIAEMLKQRQRRIRAIVAVREDGEILPPCGRCRELIRQTDTANWDTQVILPGNRIEPLSALLPFSQAAGR
jgi:cytidine deaminase